MTEQDQVAAILHEHNAVLVRSKKHLVYRFPSGKIFVASSTPSDSFRHHKNQLRDLKRVLCLHDPDRAQPGERRERKCKNGSDGKRRYVQDAPTNDSLFQKLSSAGCIEDSLREEIATLQAQNEDLRAELSATIEEAAQPCSCWWCRITSRLLR